MSGNIREWGAANRGKVTADVLAAGEGTNVALYVNTGQ